jgi:hypothetical protein
MKEYEMPAATLEQLGKTVEGAVGLDGQKHHQTWGCHRGCQSAFKNGEGTPDILRRMRL